VKKAQKKSNSRLHLGEGPPTVREPLYI